MDLLLQDHRAEPILMGTSYSDCLLQETNNYHHYIYTAFDNKRDIAGT